MNIATRQIWLTQHLPGLALLLTLLLSPSVWAQQRVALLIGNSEYKYEATLRNPVRDVQLLEGIFKDQLR
ncbi:MAG: hypothetical protein V4772_25345, partial [Pseudomonadota bacterium]